MSRREALWADFHPNVPLHTVRMDRPLSEIEALMQNRDDETERPDQQAMRAAVLACFESLPEQDQYILNARFFEQLSVRELGTRLGVSHVHVIRLTRKATERLTECLQHNDLVRERIGMEPLTWDDAAARWVRHYTLRLSNGRFEPPISRFDIGRLRDSAWTHSQSKDEYEHKLLMADIDDLALYGMLHMPPDVQSALPNLLVYKQRRYGCDNILRFGFVGIAIRMSDKVERVLQMKRRGDTDDEDPYTDLVGYAVVARMLDEGTFTLPLREDLNQEESK